jgi:hypothetical protein
MTLHDPAPPPPANTPNAIAFDPDVRELYPIAILLIAVLISIATKLPMAIQSFPDARAAVPILTESGPTAYLGPPTVKEGITPAPVPITIAFATFVTLGPFPAPAPIYMLAAPLLLEPAFEPIAMRLLPVDALKDAAWNPIASTYDAVFDRAAEMPIAFTCDPEDTEPARIPIKLFDEPLDEFPALPPIQLLLEPVENPPASLPRPTEFVPLYLAPAY